MKHDESNGINDLNSMSSPQSSTPSPQSENEILRLLRIVNDDIENKKKHSLNEEEQQYNEELKKYNETKQQQYRTERNERFTQRQEEAKQLEEEKIKQKYGEELTKTLKDQQFYNEVKIELLRPNPEIQKKLQENPNYESIKEPIIKEYIPQKIDETNINDIKKIIGGGEIKINLNYLNNEKKILEGAKNKLSKNKDNISLKKIQQIDEVLREINNAINIIENEIKNLEEVNKKIDKFLELNPPSVLSNLSTQNLGLLVSNISSWFSQLFSLFSKEGTPENPDKTTFIDIFLGNSLTNPGLNDLLRHDFKVKTIIKSPLNEAIIQVNEYIAATKLMALENILKSSKEKVKKTVHTKRIRIDHNKMTKKKNDEKSVETSINKEK